jgi:hypothetical protein
VARALPADCWGKDTGNTNVVMPAEEHRVVAEKTFSHSNETIKEMRSVPDETVDRR